MAAVAPFAGLRYNPAVVGNLADVVTPPYDVIDAGAQERYYHRHPNNIIRLEYGKVLPGDHAYHNRYTRAKSDFAAWIAEKVLLPEPAPAIYFYEQEFRVEGARMTRSGLICTVKLEPYASGLILPHEETIPKHKADRLDLLRACGANFSPVFGLYQDQELEVEQIKMRFVAAKAPEMFFTDESGESHRLWVVTEPPAIGAVQRIMADKRIFIADGHHRYETGLNYQQEQNARGKQESAPYNYIMMALVNLYDPGLVVLPTHRVVRRVAPGSLAQLLARLAEDFTVEEFTPSDRIDAPEELLAALGRRSRPDSGAGRAHVFALYAPVNRFFILELKRGQAKSPDASPGRSQAWRELDVSVLQSLIFNRVLGVSDELIAKGEHLAYVRDAATAAAMVDSGEYQLAFLLNPTLKEEIIKVAGGGEKMPQKSTFFYPKLISGLVLNRF